MAREAGADGGGVAVGRVCQKVSVIQCNAKFTGMFFSPFFELDFNWNWIAGLEVLMAVDMVSA